MNGKLFQPETYLNWIEPETNSNGNDLIWKLCRLETDLNWIEQETVSTRKKFELD